MEARSRPPAQVLYLPWNRVVSTGLDGQLPTVDLENKLLDFRTYFNHHRTHTSREGRTPDPPASQPAANLRSFRWQPHCRALYQTPLAA
jgi:hypothetical protein